MPADPRRAAIHAEGGTAASREDAARSRAVEAPGHVSDATGLERAADHKGFVLDLGPGKQDGIEVDPSVLASGAPAEPDALHFPRRRDREADRESLARGTGIGPRGGGGIAAAIDADLDPAPGQGEQTCREDEEGHRVPDPPAHPWSHRKTPAELE